MNPDKQALVRLEIQTWIAFRSTCQWTSQDLGCFAFSGQFFDFFGLLAKIMPMQLDTLLILSKAMFQRPLQPERARWSAEGKCLPQIRLMDAQNCLKKCGN